MNYKVLPGVPRLHPHHFSPPLNSVCNIYLTPALSPEEVFSHPMTWHKNLWHYMSTVKFFLIHSLTFNMSMYPWKKKNHLPDVVLVTSSQFNKLKQKALYILRHYVQHTGSIYWQWHKALNHWTVKRHFLCSLSGMNQFYSQLLVCLKFKSGPTKFLNKIAQLFQESKLHWM